MSTQQLPVDDCALPESGSGLHAWIDSIALIGPGLPDWATASAVLRGDQPWQPVPTVVTLPAMLPPAERRRTSLAVRLALAAGHQAIAESSFQGEQLASVFTSSGGDGPTCHLICTALASDDRRISPTHFHNSVHNAPSGYWGIAMRATAASTSLCGHDSSFGAGLLEALTQMIASGEPVILVAYDAPYPEPLRECRPIADAFAVALVLAPNATARSTLRIGLNLAPADPTSMSDPALEAMRLNIPTARALPLLQAIARQQPASVVIDYLHPIAATPAPDRICLSLSPTSTSNLASPPVPSRAMPQ